jgi:ribosomal protein S18 acetylase RimI-like enzyme
MGMIELDEADIPRAAGLIARAFDQDPLLLHMLPDRGLRARLGPVHLEPVVRMCTRHGSAWRTEEFDAVAAWMPPGGWPPEPALVEECGFAQAADAVGPEAMARFNGVYALVDGFAEQVTPNPYWLLNLVGTEPGRRRRGAASAALAPVLVRAGANGVPCYLETFAERNLAFYRRHGFEVVAQAGDAAAGIRCWAMLRA